MGNRYWDVLAVSALVFALAAPASAADPALTCEKTAGLSLFKCVKKVAGFQRKCFKKNDAECGSDDPKIVKALDKLSAKVSKKCPSDAVVQQSGYAALTVPSLIARLQTACLAESDSLVARTYGGPHGAVWDAANDERRSCLDKVFNEGRKYLGGAAKTQMKCVDKQRKSGNCDLAKTQAKLDKLRTKAFDKIEAACSGEQLQAVIALFPNQYLDRVSAQAACMTAISHADVAPLDLDCGPRDAVPTIPRGEYTQIVLDQADWESKCGHGGDYAFWIRPAPAGHPVENVVLQMQGGGVCLNDSGCGNASSGLFEALNDNPSQSGIMSNDTNTSPFANWTKVFLPYCTQDVFIGGGVVNDFNSGAVHRFGAVNTRVALRYLRDVLWRLMDEDSEGYRSDRIKMLFGGTSAGAFGTLYNYHYVLDDLQWIHTSAWPDAGLALDNGQALGVANLGLIFTGGPGAPFYGWLARPFLPPYCFAGACGVGPTVYTVSAPRLKREPEQQFLVLSNQVDNTQVNTTFFSSAGAWINTLRQSYCDTKDTTGLRYFLPAITSSTHVIATKTNLYTGQAVDGIVMRDWLDAAMSDPDNVPDAVEEGSLVGSISGVNAFPCSID